MATENTITLIAEKCDFISAYFRLKCEDCSYGSPFSSVTVLPPDQGEKKRVASYIHGSELFTKAKINNFFKPICFAYLCRKLHNYMADEKIIFSMNGVSKVLPHNNKVILKDIYLGFFYGAKIGILGLKSANKST